MSTSWDVVVTHSALSIFPVAGFSRALAPSTASSDSSATVSRQPRASRPGWGTHSDQPPASSPSTRSRNIACRSSSACNSTTTSASVAAAGACTTTVWLNCSVSPATPANQRMIGVAGSSPVPSSTGPPASATTVATRASRATVCSTKISRGRHNTPAARARDTTCMDRMLSPPRSKNDSSTPTRSSPNTWAYTPARISSMASAGARYRSASWYSGSGRARASSLPLTVIGMASIATTAAGTMYGGSRSASTARAWPGSAVPVM
ncbi:hypothetical protein MYSI104531_24575 [Mycobacterium simiae]